MRYALMMLCLLLGTGASASTQVSVGISIPGVSIGINLPAYPEFVVVPGYPVYYAPQLEQNYFFYDGVYWVFSGENWYVSHWYNGPWDFVYPEYVPLYVLRVPVRYYRRPPVYFRGWQSAEPPRWGDHWGHDWERQRSGWDHWDRRAVPAPAPLPTYQRQYSGEHYPSPAQQPLLQKKNYRYQPRDAAVQQHYQRREQDQRQQQGAGQPAPQREPQTRQQELQRRQPYNPPSSAPVRNPPPQQRRVEVPRPVQPAPVWQQGPNAPYQRQSPQQGQSSQQGQAVQHRQQMPQQNTAQPGRQVHGPAVQAQGQQPPQRSRQGNKENNDGQNDNREGEGRRDR